MHPGMKASLLRSYEEAIAAIAAADAVNGDINCDGVSAESEEAALKLSQLGEQQVTAALLLETDLGLKVKALTKSSDRRIKEGAKAVIAVWKANIVQQRTR